MFSLNRKCLIIVVELSLVLVVASDYCNILKCSNPNQHVMCKYPENKVSDSCTNYFWKIEKSEFTEDEKRSLIQAHKCDKINNNHCIDGELEWDDDLEQMAQRWAQQCPGDNENDNCRSLDKLDSIVFQSVSLQKNVLAYVNIIDKIDVFEVAENLSQKSNNPVFSVSEKLNSINRIGCGIVVRSHKVKPLISAPSRLPSALFRPYETHKHIVCNYAIA